MTARLDGALRGRGFVSANLPLGWAAYAPPHAPFGTSADMGPVTRLVPY